MKPLSTIREAMGNDWIPQIYAERVRPLRTRSFTMEIPERENVATIMQTLLGVELKIGRRRIACPNLVTAEYLQIFASLGCGEIAVPYDITELTKIADITGSAMDGTFAELDKICRDIAPQQRGRVRAALVRQMREEIRSIGAGELMPLFNKSTKQRET
jgi:hypothetical protein